MKRWGSVKVGVALMSWLSSPPTAAPSAAPAVAAYTIALAKDHYLPGDTLRGYVSLELHEPTPVSAIEVRVYAVRVSPNESSTCRHDPTYIETRFERDVRRAV